MDKKDIKVAIVDNSIDPSVYHPVRHWASFLDVQWRAFRAKEGNLPNLNENFTHLILTGSEASIIDIETWVEREIELIQDAVDKNLAVFGSCYGHQILALALAGRKHVRRCAHHEIGWFPIEITKESSLLGERKIIYAFSSHFDEVFNLGESFSVLSVSEKCEIQAFQWKEKPVWGLQFHPEITVPEAIRFIKSSAVKPDKRAPLYREAMDLTPKDSGLIHKIIANFIE
ncbi:MAG: gamma-glutamyl-gamma-aminobutyrate hydrolase family protein [Candidatus Aminicenantes bacterium]|nr:gamma-glutamyl-gamma-aminobutyrate hydrolase family protein [Candidatus Aminicenantes bacterium]